MIDQKRFEMAAQKVGLDDAAKSATERILNVMDQMSPDARAIALQVMRNQVDGKPRTQGVVPQTDTQRFFVEATDAIDAVRAWADGSDLVMTRPQGSSWHKLRACHKTMRVVDGVDGMLFCDLLFEVEPHVLLVEHDWHAAFKTAADFDLGAFRLPFPACCFEFVLNGRRVIAMVREAESGISMRPFVQHKDLWVAGMQYDLRDDQWETAGGGMIRNEEQLGALLADQIRAIAILLETRAFVSDPVEPPAKLNKARVKRGEAPLATHHVVRIPPERRARKEQASDGHDPKWRVRCHFRRGHWRHYATHKTWVKWMIVGDPNLGFVDKEYRV
jgi:hypothetical protein